MIAEKRSAYKYTIKSNTIVSYQMSALLAGKYGPEHSSLLLVRENLSIQRIGDVNASRFVWIPGNRRNNQNHCDIAPVFWRNQSEDISAQDF
jgi:hypothetical protein